MNIDEKIKQALNEDSDELQKLLKQEPGLMHRLLDTYKGSSANWMILTTVIAFVLTGFFIWFFVEFYQAQNVMDRVFWGVLFLAGLLMQALIKMWAFMEANRNSLMREIKRIEMSFEIMAKEK